MMIHHTLKIVAMSPTENLISYPPKLDELSIVDFAVHNAIQLRSQLGITLFWGDNLVPKISFSVPVTGSKVTLDPFTTFVKAFT